MSKRKFLFIDRDGTLIHEPADKQIDTLEKLALEPHVIPSLLALQAKGYVLVMVSNQDGLGTENYIQEDFECVQDKLMNLLSSQGIQFEAIKICPHWVSDNCDCRKPRLGLVMDYLGLEDIDRARSCVIGDRQTDLLLAENMRLPGILYSRATNNWQDIVMKLSDSQRRTTLQRKTNETMIGVSVDLDATSPVAINTQLGFFDHMLEQLTKHAGISVRLDASSDMHVDEHHLVEDSALVLGQAIRNALGDKLGINRYGFLLPMDESLAQVAIDLSGRSYFVFEGRFLREKVGELSTELVPHFFRSFADSLGASLNIKVSGENEHHMIESLFKAVGRALRQAIAASGNDLPSTKGVL
jgi:imidazoleglycerol-phosphate dehydratase/histidinol-phosphatase